MAIKRRDKKRLEAEAELSMWRSEATRYYCCMSDMFDHFLAGAEPEWPHFDGRESPYDLAGMQQWGRRWAGELKLTPAMVREFLGGYTEPYNTDELLPFSIEFMLFLLSRPEPQADDEAYMRRELTESHKKTFPSLSPTDTRPPYLRPYKPPVDWECKKETVLSDKEAGENE